MTMGPTSWCRLRLVYGWIWAPMSPAWTVVMDAFWLGICQTVSTLSPIRDLRLACVPLHQCRQRRDRAVDVIPHNRLHQLRPAALEGIQDQRMVLARRHLLVCRLQPHA